MNATAITCTFVVLLLLLIIKNYNFLDCDWFKKLIFSTNSLAKLLSDSLLLDTLLLDSLLSDSSIRKSHSKVVITCVRACVRARARLHLCFLAPNCR